MQEDVVLLRIYRHWCDFPKLNLRKCLPSKTKTYQQKMNQKFLLSSKSQLMLIASKCLLMLTHRCFSMFYTLCALIDCNYPHQTNLSVPRSYSTWTSEAYYLMRYRLNKMVCQTINSTLLKNYMMNNRK